ncbi:conserved exported hypothetical protein [Tenacibaculum litopenaei]|jgi:YHS domain-containing protein|uniref:YHS domain-containing (seleno)protein n=1 Tax=Tenacibaculum litopenaei TaxID=396016 RepID=UPI0038950C47
MKNTILLLFLTISCGLYAQQIDYNTKNGFIAEGYDVVSYFTKPAPVKGKKKFQTTHDGVKFAFANAENLKIFQKNPTAYIPQYGGYCAYAVAAKKKKMYIDAEAYEIRDGKLYLFYNSWISNKLTDWKNGDTKQLQNQGDKNWSEIKFKN